MKIASTDLQMASSHAALQHRQTKESLRMQAGQKQANLPATTPPPPRPESTSVNLSDTGKATQSADEIIKNLDDALDNDPGLKLIRQMLEFMTGQKMNVFNASDFETSLTHTEISSASVNTASQSAGYGIAYDYSESYTEMEQTNFSASGTVKTSDGREVSFSIQISMERIYHEEKSVSLRLGDAARPVDPLVLNFNGTAAQLSDQRFSFDLNADGRIDQINGLKPGSGFLVFDRNNDGKINNGREMFGPTSGNGFSELSTLDEDKNGWIDESDSAYNKLKIWQGAENGTGKLQSLADAGVGAIALSHINTPFDIKTDDNTLLARVRSSGIFLQEHGETGTIQQIDLTV